MRLNLSDRGVRRYYSRPPSPLFLIIIFLLFVASCGRKGSPTLKSYEKPESPSLQRVIHREDALFLTWDFPKDKEETISCFVLLRSSGEGFAAISKPDPGKRTFADGDIQNGKTYRYKIVSESLRGVLSVESNTVEITPLSVPDPPARLSFEVEDGLLNLGWKGVGEGVFYNVYRTFEKGAYGFTPVNGHPISGQAFKDPFRMDRKVYYTVRGLLNEKTRDEGPASEEIEVDPLEFVPPAPKEVRYFATPDRVFLLWKAAEEGWVRGYRVYRRSVGQDFIFLGETQIPTFVDKEADLRRRDYRITSVGPEREGPPAEIDGVIYVPEEQLTPP